MAVRPELSKDLEKEPVDMLLSLRKKSTDISAGRQTPSIEEQKGEKKVSGLAVTDKMTDRSAKDAVEDHVNRISYPYSILLASYSRLENAKKALVQYEKMGLSSYYVKVDLGTKGIWFRVFTGHFSGKEEAKEFIAKRNLASAILKHTRYAVYLNAYDGQDGVKEKTFMVMNLGYSPYVIRDVEGKARLYIGAFEKEKDAENLQIELGTKAVQSRWVER
jgi:cell division septation protein DedD